MRFYDPDGHLIEVAESVRLVAQRFRNEGLSNEEIALRFGDDLKTIESLLDLS